MTPSENAHTRPDDRPGSTGSSLRRRAEAAGEAAAEVAAGAATEIAQPGAPVEDRTAAAFFDVDNTVMQGASLYHLAKGMYERKFFSTRDLIGMIYKQAYFRYVGSENPEHISSTREAALAFIKGLSAAEIEDLSEQIFDEAMGAMIWPGTRAHAQTHLDHGQRVWLVTAAPVEVATTISRRLGLTGAMGTVAEREDGLYTGRLVGDLLHGPAKAEAILALAEREGLDLSRCSAYSDSYNDLPMLSLVGDPVAINPDRALRTHARAKGWRIHDYRTGRKAVKYGVLAGAAGGLVAGAIAGAVAVRRRP